MKKIGGKAPKKEEIAEDWCFTCKDGGLLMVCEYKHCLKAYHTDCVNKDDSFVETRNHWTCDLHSCFICHKSSKFHCVCCPKAVCRRCIKDAAFVQIKGKKGICRNCLKLALLIEENMDVDSDGGTVDFKDRETYEGLFREYWEIINKKEGLTLEILQSADVIMKKGKNYLFSSDSDEHDKCEENEVTSDFDCTDDIIERKPNHRRKRSKEKTSAMKKKKTSNKKEFIGWGSRALMQFLKSMDIDVSQTLSQRHVTVIINDYIRERKLFHPEKKRLVICDEALRTFLGRKRVNKLKIYDYLDPHFSENQQSSEEDEIGYNSEDKIDSFVACKRRRKSGKDRTLTQKKGVGYNIPQFHYASIVPENISLVYLRRSLVHKQLLQPETFESKVIGSFVKVKSDPNDYFKKNSFQLMQVTGTTRSSGGDNGMKILLQVSGVPNDVGINLLSDNDISVEECEELKLCIKGGLLKQPTVVELEQKARSLHEDITKHWITRELDLLQNRIDQANEKGWRRQLYEYLERRQILQTSKEQERLLQQIPYVIAAVGELELISENIKVDKQEDEITPKFIQMGSSETLRQKWEGNGITSGDSAAKGRNSSARNIEFGSANVGLRQEKDENTSAKVTEVAKEKEHHTIAADEQANAILQSYSLLYGSFIAGSKQSQQTDIEQGTAKASKTQQALTAQLVDLTNDEDDNNKSSVATEIQEFEDPESRVWHCIALDGERKGPYSLAFLKRLKDNSPCSSKFKVWKTGQNEENSITLNDAITLLHQSSRL